MEKWKVWLNHKVVFHPHVSEHATVDKHSTGTEGLKLGSEYCPTTIVTPPHAHPTSHVASFARPSTTLVLQVTNTGVRKPDYEGRE